MSLINRKVDYALRTLLYLAREQNGSYISSAELSAKLRVPRVFLAKIFQALSRRGIVKTSRGKVGGVRLIDKSVPLSMIIRILDPAFSLNKCMKRNGSCYFKTGCAIHKVLIDADRELQRNLGKKTLLELASNN